MPSPLSDNNADGQPTGSTPVPESRVPRSGSSNLLTAVDAMDPPRTENVSSPSRIASPTVISSSPFTGGTVDSHPSENVTPPSHSVPLTVNWSLPRRSHSSTQLPIPRTQLTFQDDNNVSSPSNRDKALPSPPMAQAVDPNSPPKSGRTLVDSDFETPSKSNWPILSPDEDVSGDALEQSRDDINHTNAGTRISWQSQQQQQQQTNRSASVGVAPRESSNPFVYRNPESAIAVAEESGSPTGEIVLRRRQSQQAARSRILSSRNPYAGSLATIESELARRRILAAITIPNRNSSLPSNLRAVGGSESPEVVLACGTILRFLSRRAPGIGPTLKIYPDAESVLRGPSDQFAELLQSPCRSSVDGRSVVSTPVQPIRGMLNVAASNGPWGYRRIDTSASKAQSSVTGEVGININGAEQQEHEAQSKTNPSRISDEHVSSRNAIVQPSMSTSSSGTESQTVKSYDATRGYSPSKPMATTDVRSTQSDEKSRRLSHLSDIQELEQRMPSVGVIDAPLIHIVEESTENKIKGKRSFRGIILGRETKHPERRRSNIQHKRSWYGNTKSKLVKRISSTVLSKLHSSQSQTPHPEAKSMLKRESRSMVFPTAVNRQAALSSLEALSSYVPGNATTATDHDAIKALVKLTDHVKEMPTGTADQFTIEALLQSIECCRKAEESAEKARDYAHDAKVHAERGQMEVNNIFTRGTSVWDGETQSLIQEYIRSSGIDRLAAEREARDALEGI
ncbi:hypothetical protein IAQ61_000879 [Plenodomus lingam]|uniref:uncharacterized protein n=1 Tax=Leptosphaeria maculans TaxID=5022 RepID=UPI00331ABC58|nr:hypothetical protein IAQ61_000879 [Plenodomus lingam]